MKTANTAVLIWGGAALQRGDKGIFVPAALATEARNLRTV